MNIVDGGLDNVSWVCGAGVCCRNSDGGDDSQRLREGREGGVKEGGRAGESWRGTERERKRDEQSGRRQPQTPQHPVKQAPTSHRGLYSGL